MSNPNNNNKDKSVFEIIMSSKPSTSPIYQHTQALHRAVPAQSDNPYSLDQLTRTKLPYFLPWSQTAGPNEVAPDFSWLTNSCGGKAAIGVIGGGVMGLLMGVFLGAMSDATPPVQVIGGKEVPQAPLREQLRVTMRATADKSLYWGIARRFRSTRVFGAGYRSKTLWVGHCFASGPWTGLARLEIYLQHKMINGVTNMTAVSLFHNQWHHSTINVCLPPITWPCRQWNLRTKVSESALYCSH